jgi:hypothetical protein
VPPWRLAHLQPCCAHPWNSGSLVSIIISATLAAAASPDIDAIASHK